MLVTGVTKISKRDPFFGVATSTTSNVLLQKYANKKRVNQKLITKEKCDEKSDDW